MMVRLRLGMRMSPRMRLRMQIIGLGMGMGIGMIGMGMRIMIYNDYVFYVYLCVMYCYVTSLRYMMNHGANKSINKSSRSRLAARKSENFWHDVSHDSNHGDPGGIIGLFCSKGIVKLMTSFFKDKCGWAYLNYKKNYSKRLQSNTKWMDTCLWRKGTS